MSEPVFYLSAHRELWNRIIKRIPDDFKPNPMLRPAIDNVKEDEILGMQHDGTMEKLTGKLFDYTDIECGCFACQYDLECDPEETDTCAHCPLQWPYSEKCWAPGELYNAFEEAYRWSANVNKVIDLATQIRDCKIKEGIVTR